MRRDAKFLRGLIAALILSAAALPAQVAKSAESDLDQLTRVSQRLALAPDFRPIDEAAGGHATKSTAALRSFLATHDGTWSIHVDALSGHIGSLSGSGIAWIPGDGNALSLEDLDPLLAGKSEVDLEVLDRRARLAMPTIAEMFGFDPSSLVLGQGRSGNPAPHVWFVDYDVTVGGHVVEGARVVFSVNNGNLVSIDSENLPDRSVSLPPTRISRDQAEAILATYVGGFLPSDEFHDRGSFHLLPANRLAPTAGGRLAPGAGRGVVGVWDLVFEREGVLGTWRARIDAETGSIEEFTDINAYGRIQGGVIRTDGRPADSLLPMPYAEYGSGLYSNPAGIFPGTSGTTALNGQFVRIVDSCGSISRSADAGGTISLGQSASGTDCTTPGVGGTGNTRSARTQFFHLNRASDMGWGWLPSNPWFVSQLRGNVNLNGTCNAFWNGSTVNFYRSGGGCANTGELPGVALHEWGHGFDQNDGNGAPPEKGSGETYGDWTSSLVLHDSCVGRSLRGSNCGGYGNPCTSCTGSRDINWGKHADNIPSTPANFTYPLCPIATNGYYGPCGLWLWSNGFGLGIEGHCESLVSSEAHWDFVNRDLPAPGSRGAWSIAERTWFGSRSTARSQFQCTYNGNTLVSNGCNTGSAFRVLRTLDDDNGNLADGTPHGGAIAAAFARHGIACSSLAGWNTTRVAVAPPPAPVLSATPGNNSVQLAWSGSAGRYDVFRNELGCSFGFQRIANDVTTTSLTDPFVANGVTYYYQVVAHPAGNEAASSAPSACVAAMPTAGPPIPCSPNSSTLCLNQSRFRAQVSWRTPQGQAGSGQAIPYTTDSGFFWFFNNTNLEMMIKVLNACVAPWNKFWVFHAATTNVEYTLTVTDTVTGAVKTYFNPMNHAATTVLDTSAFATCSATAGEPESAETLAASAAFDAISASELSESVDSQAAQKVMRELADLEAAFAARTGAPVDPNSTGAGSVLLGLEEEIVEHGEANPAPEGGPLACTNLPQALCLNSSRFRATVNWRTPQGQSGAGQAIPYTSDSGFFWFFQSTNLEMMIKVLNACVAPWNRYWVFHAATTNVEYTLTVTDTQTGQVRTYFNPLNHAATTILDTQAFATCP
ncbi:MAG: hypothetical protein K8I65_02030 [Thermoanaerobaculia bacterium]|nr:hypothetical protein [Thermoanaerobaculia bacterium]